MKQVIAVDFECLIGNNEFFAEPETLLEIYTYIRKYNLIAIDNNAECLNDLNEINNFLISSNNINSQFFMNLFIRKVGSTDLYSSISTESCENENIYLTLAKNTPDKILVSSDNKKKINQLQFYNFNSFTAPNSKSNCVLYRIPKLYNFKPGYIFKDFSFLRPFISNSETIEFCDNYLLCNSEMSELPTIIEILKLTNNINDIKFHIKEPSNINVIQSTVKSRLKEIYPQAKIEFTHYSTKSGNHDRFIIINKNELSIHFSHSFNNIKKINDTFKAKDAFSIAIKTGRNYYD